MFIGNSFIGDTLLNLSLIRAILRWEEYDTVIFPMLQKTLADVQGPFFNFDKDYKITVVSNPGMDRGLDAICNPYPAPTETFYAGNLLFHYSEEQKREYPGRKDIEAFAMMIIGLEIHTVYLAHWSIGYMILAEQLERTGIRVLGFKDWYGGISLVGQDRLIREDGRVYTPEFIGDKLSNAFTGNPLTRSDFFLRRPEEEPTNDYVLMMPSTRAQINTIGNWNYDLEILLSIGQKVKIAFWKGDYSERTFQIEVELSKIHSKYNLIPDIIVIDKLEDTIDFIHHAKLVITPDSGQFHLAWIMDKPIIVKLKEGILYEWIPSEDLLTSPVVTLAPCKPFAAEYVMQMKRDIKELLGVND